MSIYVINLYENRKKVRVVLKHYEAATLGLEDSGSSKFLSLSEWMHPFVICHKCCLLFLLEWQTCLIHFKENICQIPQSEQLYCVCLLFFQLKTVFSEQKSTLLAALTSVNMMPFKPCICCVSFCLYHIRYNMRYNIICTTWGIILYND